MNKKKQIIIVGAGLGGLTSAAYLSREGYNVLLIEKNDTCGGLINTFSHEGFVFDTGPRSLENAGVIKPMLKDLEIDLELLKSPVSIGIEEDVFPINKKEDIQNYKLFLIDKFPENKKEIENIFKKVNKITKSMDVIYGFDNPVFTKDFTKNKEYLVNELLPWFGKFILAVLHMNMGSTPINTVLEKYTSNQALIDMISQHFFKQTPVFFALGYFYVYQEYYYPKGGTGKFTEKIAEKIIETGGKIKKNTLITSVDPKNKVITDSKGEVYNYSSLIWGADLKELYLILDSSQLDNKVKNNFLRQKEKFMASRGGDSVFSLYMGVDKPSEHFSKISNGHFFYTPKKTGLGDTHTKELNTLIDNFEKLSKDEILKWVDKYCELGTYEISIPALRQSNLVPSGKTGLIISLLFEFDLVEKVRKANWYEEFKKYVEDKMIEVLDSTIYPELKENTLFQFSLSPFSYKKRARTSEGGINGWTYEREVPVVSALQKMPKSIKTTVPDIYQVGQWAYSPAGIPTAILTGWYAADFINKKK